ncbi:30S ribosomal protein S16 [bacterium]|nr:30S ribosomal protein S16 [bacterium]
MAIKIRLKRQGKKKQPVYRLVVADSREARGGQAIEILGLYNPRSNPVQFDFNEERVKYWISVGAQLSDPVQRLLGNQGVVPVVKRTSATPGVARKDLKKK